MRRRLNLRLSGYKLNNTFVIEKTAAVHEKAKEHATILTTDTATLESPSATLTLSSRLT